MSGFEPTPEDIQAILGMIRKTKPDATEEDATRLLLQYKMEARDKAKTTSQEDMLKELDRLIEEIFGPN